MLIIRGIKELATCGLKGVIRNATIAIDGELFVDLPKRVSKKDTIIEAGDFIALPGFVDCHTHTVYAGSRAKEYEKKIGGASYADIQKAGGGIHATVNATREAHFGDLYDKAMKTLDEMFRAGTTTVEIKSGYGLTKVTEIAILRVIELFSFRAKQDVVATFLGAHTIPKEYSENRSRYLEALIYEMLPHTYREKIANGVDVFCDPLGFTAEETDKILAFATSLGFKIHIHGEQTAHFGGAKLATKYKALSLDHGDFLDDEDIALLKDAGTTVVLLPGTILHLMEWNKVDYPALFKKLKTAGVPVALATDFNPGSSPIISMKLIMDLAIRFFRMSYEDALLGATINSAKALGLSERLGSIEVGKQADMLLIRADSVADYLHQIGDREIEMVIKKGRIFQNQ
jgi:imidazolonepropionase